MSMQKGSVPFRPRARIIKLLGEELITNEVIATVELVKNSYDADATEVKISLENVTDMEEGRITIRDNGIGMSLDTVLNAWLQPGTEIKKKMRERNERSKAFGRPILGEKGVGRFAAQKLGRLITVTTRSREDDLETIVEVDWKAFDEDKFLSDVKVNWLRMKPKIFREQTGTLIEINFLNTKWTKPMVYKLARKLVSLLSPFKGKANFSIILESNDYPEVREEVKFPADILRQSVYSFHGKISERGIMTGDYAFSNPAFKRLSRKVSIEKKDIRDPDDFKENGSLRDPTSGPFEFEFYVWDLDPATLRETISRKTYDVFIKPHTGIRIHRDNFRVWPYGEEGNDWLELDRRRVNNPAKCLSNNQIIGIVEIDHDNNPALKDKTDREGLMENREYRDFKSLVLSATNELEVLRRQDKSNVDKIRERKVGKKIDETIDEIEKLHSKIRENGHEDIYSKNVNSIERAYKNYKINVVEKLYVAAGIGIAALMPAHEIQIQLKDLKPILKSLEEDMRRMGFGGRIMGRFDDIDRILSTLWDVSDGALELTKREHKEFPLRSVVDFALKVKRQDLERNNIEVKEEYGKKISLKGYRNLVITALFNLIDNSIWWLQKNAEEDRKLKITIKRDEEGNPMILVSDNGPGINPADLPYLGEAFYTRKPRGTGLGLFIASRAMEANDGKIDFGFHPKDPDYLKGANVMLVFEKAGE